MPEPRVGTEEINNRFGFHAGNSTTIPKHQLVREAFKAMAEFLDENLPHGRAKSTAFTKLQESSMWAHFGIAELAPVVFETPGIPEPNPS